MSEEKVPFEKWLKKREKQIQKLAMRLDDASKTSDEETSWTCSGFRTVYDELVDLYRALAFMYKNMYDNDKDLIKIMKTFLGLTTKASEKTTKDRAKELGTLVEDIIKKVEKRRPQMYG